MLDARANGHLNAERVLVRTSQHLLAKVLVYLIEQRANVRTAPLGSPGVP